MSKVVSLREAVSSVAGLAPKQEPVSYAQGAPSRRGKKGIVIYVDPVVAKQLRRIALDHDKTIQSLGEDAINGLLERYGEKPIA
jgi:hypothetical protein